MKITKRQLRQLINEQPIRRSSTIDSEIEAWDQIELDLVSLIRRLGAKTHLSPRQYQQIRQHLIELINDVVVSPGP